MVLSWLKRGAPWCERGFYGISKIIISLNIRVL